MQKISPVSALVARMRHSPSPELAQVLTERFPEMSLGDSLWVLKSETRKFSSIRNLCIFDVQRQIHMVSANHVVDVLCLCARGVRIDSSVVDMDVFIARFLKEITSLSPRKISLGLWAVSRISPSRLYLLVEALLAVEDDKIIQFSARDKTLVARSLMKSVTNSRTPKQTLLECISVIERLGFDQSQCKTFSCIEASICLHAFAQLKRFCKKLSVDFNEDALHKVLERISNLLKTKSSIFSTESLLTIASAFSLLRFKAQPVLVDLYRSLYSRLDSLRTDQKSFALFLLVTESGLRDNLIVSSFINALKESPVEKLSNQNLIQLAEALTQSNCSSDEFKEQVLLELFSRNDTLKPAQRIACLALTPLLRDSVMDRIDECSVSEIVRLLTLVDRKWDLQRVLLERLKKKQKMTHTDMLLLAAEIRKLGPHNVKTNLRMRFNRILVRAICEKVIPSHSLLLNLKLIDDIGAFHCLPLTLQRMLWSKLTDGQKIDVRSPLNPTRGNNSRNIPSDQLLFRVEDNWKDQIREEDNSFAESCKKEKAEREANIELEELSQDGETPISKFIKIVRRM